MNEKNFSNLIAFWRAVEALSPQMLPKLAEKHKTEPVVDWAAGTPAPWLTPEFRQRSIPATHAWRHTIYAASYQRAGFIDLLEVVLGKQPGIYEERTTGQSCVFTIAFDESGRPQPDTFVLGMAAWACGIVITRDLAALTAEDACSVDGLNAPAAGGAAPPPATSTGLPGFDRQAAALRADLAWRVGNLPEDHEAEDLAWFDDFVRTVIDRCQIRQLAGSIPVHRVRSFQARRPKNTASAKEPESAKVKGDDDLINSFYIRDLNRILDAELSGAGGSLRRFIEPPAGMTRTDVRRDRCRALDLLDPRLVPEGCWPAEHPLVWSQQLAINTLWRNLAGGTGTFAVNGPPGTGKTTLLRDVVAAVVVERAQVLAAGGSQLLAAKKSVIEIGGRSFNYYLPDPKLAGFSIVIASSNNGAVENVSLELPKANAIHKIWAGKSQAYPDLAGDLIGQPAWALIAGRLGNKENRNDFVSRFWWQSTAKSAKVPGLLERLRNIDAGTMPPALAWPDAVKAFKDARTAENECRKRVAQYPVLLASLAALLEAQAKDEAEHATASAERAAAGAEHNTLQAGLAGVAQDLASVNERIALHREVKPDWWDWLCSLGRLNREWREALASMIAELKPLQDAEKDLQRRAAALLSSIAKIDQHLQGLASAIQKRTPKIDDTELLLDAGRRRLGKYWPDLHADEETQERSSPWAEPEWREARIKVFLAAIDLHRAFLEANPWKMRDNLSLAMQMLGGGIPDANARAVALDSLALVCPVISTTFASVPSLFGELGPDSIGWLLIDEAGQATPPAAAGAIWRARRSIVVGDPLQLEPVVTLPRTVEAALAANHGRVDRRWHPTRTSVQGLADASTPTGTAVGDDEDAIWVGAPLRVHRRCDEPMFSISNLVAYDGMMVHQKDSSAVMWPKSEWIDVPRGPASGNWLPAEGDALRALLRDLQAAGVPPADIFLVSPFRDVVNELHRFGKSFGLDPTRVGTVHTTQGKEAEVVIVVLGGGSAGARDWAAEKPNLLNVAASRAKARLYVIGDRADWAKRKHFDVLDRELGPAVVVAKASNS